MEIMRLILRCSHSLCLIYVRSTGVSFPVSPSLQKPNTANTAYDQKKWSLRHMIKKTVITGKSQNDQKILIIRCYRYIYVYLYADLHISTYRYRLHYLHEDEIRQHRTDLPMSLICQGGNPLKPCPCANCK